jgi:putative phage head-tail adaptor|nr:MAG TPA: Putative head tail adaptor [Caudoviricetes sp.]
MIANPGRLNRRISIYSKDKALTTNGFNTIKESKVCDCWAAIYPVRMTDIKENSTIQTVNNVKFTIRFRQNIDSNMTIKYDSKTFRIIGIVNPFYDNESLEIIAEEVSRGKNTNDKTIGSK